MSVETFTIEYSGVSKKNPKFGSIKSTDGTWYGCPLNMLPSLSKGQTVSVQVEKKGDYSNITGMAQGGSNVAPGIPKEAGMAAMGVVGRAFQGLGSLPDQATLASMFLTVAGAWMDAQKALAEPDPGNDAPF